MVREAARLVSVDPRVGSEKGSADKEAPRVDSEYKEELRVDLVD